MVLLLLLLDELLSLAELLVFDDDVFDPPDERVLDDPEDEDADPGELLDLLDDLSDEEPLSRDLAIRSPPSTFRVQP